MRFKKILCSPTSTNHSLNARSPLGNDESLDRPDRRRVAVLGRIFSRNIAFKFLNRLRLTRDDPFH